MPCQCAVDLRAVQGNALHAAIRDQSWGWIGYLIAGFIGACLLRAEKMPPRYFCGNMRPL